MKDFPDVGTTLSWGSKDVNKPATILSKPLNTDNMQTIAVVAIVTPSTDIEDMILMEWCDFLEKM